MKEQLRHDGIVGIQSTDVIQVDVDISKDSTYKREMIKLYVDKDREVDEREVIKNVREKMKYKFSRGEFKQKYTEFEPGDTVQLNIIYWLRQPFI